MLAALTTLTNSEQRVYDCLRPRGHDVCLAVLYRTIYRHWPDEGLTRKRVQQAVSPYISRLNKKLAECGSRAVPGRLRGTYRLVRM